MRNIRHRPPKGFTLVELMVVIVIIGILAAIAIPQFANYSARAKVSSVAIYQGRLKIDVSSFFESSGHLPSALSEIDVPSTLSHDYIDSIAISGGGAGSTIMTLTYTMKANRIGSGMSPSTNTLEYKASANGGEINWDCTGGTMDAKFRPGICRP